jgi:hypothetical protein
MGDAPRLEPLAGAGAGRRLSEPRRTFVELLEFDGEDLRGRPLTARKEVLARLLRGAPAGIALNAHYEAGGAIVYKHACALAARAFIEAPRLALPLPRQGSQSTSPARSESSLSRYCRPPLLWSRRGGFHRIRHYGLFANGNRAAISRGRASYLPCRLAPNNPR